jgi:hypothetical protein
METQIISILCEGPHDVAFITKILKTIGFESNEELKIGEFPFPINNLLKTEVTKTKVEELNLQEVRQTLLPLNTLRRDQNYLFLYSMGGDSKILKNSQPLLSEFISFIPQDEGGFDEALPVGTRLSLIYFLDSDYKGIVERLNELNNEIKKTVNVTPFEHDRTITIVKKIKLGTFIFTGLDNNTGKLEDILIPLMEQDNEDIFKNAEQFLSVNFDEKRLFKLKLEVSGTQVIEKRSEKTKDKLKYDALKSRIGVVGQLQKSGSNNVVCIGQTDYLTLDKIKKSLKCQEIVSFFEEFLVFEENNQLK